MRRLDRAAAALPEGAFAVVMGTGIVSLACRSVLPVASEVLLWLGAGVLVAIGGLIGWRRGRTRLTPPAAWWDAVTFVAAATTVAAGLRAAGHSTPATGLDVAALVGWLWLIARPAPWKSAAGRKPEDVSGRRLLAVVATQSAVISAATIARHGHGTALEGVTLAVWTMAILIYLPMVLPVIRGIVVRTRAGSFRADDWISTGALAISALAADALLSMPGAPLRPEVRALGLAALVGACLWIPVLVRLDLAPPRRWWPPGAERWSMVFPLGMFSAACQALGHAASVPTAVQLGRAAAWVAVAAWVGVAAGCAVRGVGIARDSTLDTGSARARARVPE